MVVIRLENLAAYISWFIITLLPSSLTWIYNIGSTPPWSSLPFSCHVHWNTYTYSYFLNISYIYLSFKVFYCFLILGKLFNFHIQKSNTCNQHHLYNIFEKRSIFSCLICGHTRIYWVTLTTRERVLSSIYKVKRMYELV